jgi:GNAT superfamily N-acetyltransferase
LIREFMPGDEAAFRTLNEEWIRRYFVLEAKDKAAFDDPQRTILDAGGRIFLAIEEGRPVGCCALQVRGPGEFEIVKMGVTESWQGRGLGRRLLERAIAEGFAFGATRLYLETNHQLGAAIRLYESLGFRHVPAERFVPSPYVRADVFMELFREGHLMRDAVSASK